MFKLSILVLFSNVMGLAGGGGLCRPQQILDYITEESQIEKIDWCKYVFKCMKESKKNWEKDNVKSHYTGPLLALILIYLHSTHCVRDSMPHKTPAIQYWSSDDIKDRDNFEFNNGGFGILELYKKVNDDNDSIENKLKMDKLSKNVDLLQRILSDINSEIKICSSKIPDNVRLKEIKAKFSNFIRNEYLSEQDTMYKEESENDETMGFEKESEDLNEEKDKDEETGFEKKNVEKSDDDNDDFWNVHVSDDSGKERQNNPTTGFDDDDDLGFENENENEKNAENEDEKDEDEKENENEKNAEHEDEEDENENNENNEKNTDCQRKEKFFEDDDDLGFENQDDVDLGSEKKNENENKNSDDDADGFKNFSKEEINENEKKNENQSTEEVFETGHGSKSKDGEIKAKEDKELHHMQKRKRSEDELERRQKQRVEEVRESEKKKEESVNLKEQYRIEVRERLAMIERSWGFRSFLFSLDMYIPEDNYEFKKAKKNALVKFHPDRVQKDDLYKLVEAEETFKVIQGWKDPAIVID